MSIPTWGYGPGETVATWGYGTIDEIIKIVITQLNILKKKIRSLIISGTIRESPIQIEITVR